MKFLREFSTETQLGHKKYKNIKHNVTRCIVTTSSLSDKNSVTWTIPKCLMGVWEYSRIEHWSSSRLTPHHVVQKVRKRRSCGTTKNLTMLPNSDWYSVLDFQEFIMSLHEATIFFKNQNTIFTWSNAATIIDLIHQSCAASIQEQWLFENGVYFTQPISSMTQRERNSIVWVLDI